MKREQYEREAAQWRLRLKGRVRHEVAHLMRQVAQWLEPDAPSRTLTYTATRKGVYTERTPYL